MNQKFKIGDKVKLKSGSPVMTIQQLKVIGKHEGIFKCKWFNGEKQDLGYFHKDSLEIVDEDSPKDNNS